MTVADGRAIKVEGDPDHPTTRGVLCTKVARYLERTYSDQRVLHPMRRVGAKGEGRFERIGWDEALDTIASRFREIAASTDGPQAIVPYSYAGTMGLLQCGSMDRRFFHKLGASLLDRTICATRRQGRLCRDDRRVDRHRPRAIRERQADPDLGLATRSSPTCTSGAACRKPSAAARKLIAIDPYRSQTAEKCHEHLALLPGTDAALALGMMHVLIAEDLLDRDYIDRYTLGFDALEQRVRDYPPARVAALTGLPRSSDRRARARLRHDRAGGDPPQLRHAKARRRRHGDAHDRLPAGADRRMAPPRGRRASIVQRHLSRSTRRRWSAPT